MSTTIETLLAALIIFSTSTAYASTYHGIVQEIGINASSSGGTRVSVLTSGTTDCHGGDNHWYSYEYSKAGPGSAWLAVLLSAKVAQETVVLHGTGTCDALGMERVAAIDLPSASRPLSQDSPSSEAPPVLSLHICPKSPSSARLENLDSQTRVPGQHYIMFKLPAALACIGTSQLSSLRVLPRVMPDSPQAYRRLAHGLARSIHATVTRVWDSLPAGFDIGDATDGGVEMLARDPRIALIGANLTIKEQAPDCTHGGTAFRIFEPYPNARRRGVPGSNTLLPRGQRLRAG